MMRARLAAFTRHGDLPTSLSIFGAGLLGVLGVAPATACRGGAGGVSPVRAAPVPPPPAPAKTGCRNPKRRLGYDGKDTGFVECEGGAAHRAGTAECSRVPRATECPAGGVPEPDNPCRLDTDCNDRPNGFCTRGMVGGCSCDYGCSRDSDCAAGAICFCGTPVGKCIPAECITDADCSGGMLCLAYEQYPGCGGTALACQTPADQCLSDSDCGTPEAHGYCWRQVDGHRACSNDQCMVGRPFVVAGQARVAGVRSRTDWCASLSPRLDGLGAGAKAELAARWTEIALMEHASIAAFARFALELLSLGAPAELVEHAQRAMADEVSHARDAFALASAFAGRAVGPGPLEVRDAFSATSMVDVVRAAVLEGCIGETVAAVEAAEALAVTEDEAVRCVLQRVAADEATHAELAFRFVKWAIEHTESALLGELAGEVTRIVEAARSSCPETVNPSPYVLSSHGVLAADARAAIRRHVIDEVVVPCIRAIATPALRAAQGKPLGVFPAA